MMSAMFSTFSRWTATLLARAASSMSFTVALQLAQPVPSTLMCFMSRLLVVPEYPGRQSELVKMRVEIGGDIDDVLFRQGWVVVIAPARPLTPQRPHPLDL